MKKLTSILSIAILLVCMISGVSAASPPAPIVVEPVNTTVSSPKASIAPKVSFKVGHSVRFLFVAEDAQTVAARLTGSLKGKDAGSARASNIAFGKTNLNELENFRETGRYDKPPGENMNTFGTEYQARGRI